jgi:hypothetical protein
MTRDPLAYQDPQAIVRLDEFKELIRDTISDRVIEDIKVVCSTSQGRRLVWELLDFCGVYGCSFVPGMSGITEFNEGKRSVGVRLLNRVNAADKSMIQKILLEHWSEAQSNKAQKYKILGAE